MNLQDSEETMTNFLANDQGRRSETYMIYRNVSIKNDSESFGAVCI